MQRLAVSCLRAPPCIEDARQLLTVSLAPSHQRCVRCLGQEDARQLLAVPCPFTLKVCGTKRGKKMHGSQIEDLCEGQEDARLTPNTRVPLRQSV